MKYRTGHSTDTDREVWATLGDSLRRMVVRGETERMPMSMEATPRRPGRPATGKDPHMTARFPAELVAIVEDWAAQNDVSRSEAIRKLVQLGLNFSKFTESNCC